MASGADEAHADAFVQAVVDGGLDVPELTDRERALLRYAEKLTLDPAAITADDVERLRSVGLDDRAIHDACAIVGYYAFVNRIADGLGVELESPPPGEP